MSSFYTFIILLLVTAHLFTSGISAAEPTTVSSPSASLQTKLKVLQEEIASKAAKLKQEISRKLQNRVFVGYLKSKSNSSFLLAAKSGSRLVNINNYTEYSNQIKSKTKKVGKMTFSNIAPEDYLVALGDIDDNEVLTAKKVIKIAPDKTLAKQIIFGKVTSFDHQILTLKDKDGQKITFSLSEDTLLAKAGSSSDSTTIKPDKLESSFKSLKLNQTLIITGEGLEGEGLKARLIYLTATSSAKIKP